MTKVYSHLSAEERVRIDELRNREGLGVCQIALRIGRDKSTVSREPGRGLWVASDENGSYRPYRPKRLKAGAWTSRPFYSAMTAQRKAETRARESRRPMRMSYSPLLAWVMDALRKGWTPERIEGRLKVEWPDDPRMRISHDASTGGSTRNRRGRWTSGGTCLAASGTARVRRAGGRGDRASRCACRSRTGRRR